MADQANDFTFCRAMKAELLDAETELQLAYLWRDHKDEQALHRLITAYMRLAISMAKIQALWRAHERPYSRGGIGIDEGRREI